MRVLDRPPAVPRRALSLLLALALSLLLVSVAPTRASALPSVSVTSTTTLSVPPNSTTPLAGASVSTVNPDASVVVTVTTDRGTLSTLSTSGLTLFAGSSWSGGTSMTFSGPVSMANAALVGLVLDTGNDGGTVAAVSVAAVQLPPGYGYAPSTGHYYRYIPAALGITHDSAGSAASSMFFRGQAGYLATIPNAEVNGVLTALVGSDTDAWFDGSSDAYVFDGTERVWTWADGPLATQAFTSCTLSHGTCDFTSDAGRYHNWATGQPDNAGGQYLAPSSAWESGETATVTSSGSAGAWSDVPGTYSGHGYLVEFGDQVLGGSTLGGPVTASSDVAITSTPGAPTGVSGVAEDGGATVTFTAPVSDGGSPITGYVVTSSPGGVTATCLSSPCEVTGLTNGQEYTFTVHAVTALDSSVESSPSNAVTPARPPGQPTVLTSSGGDGSATLTFDAPTDDGGSPVTEYTLTASPGNHTATCSSSPCVVTGLTNGQSYELTLVATNAAGSSDPTDAVPVSPAGAPGAPTGVTAARGNGSATVTFTAPVDDGGNEIQYYTVSAAPGGASANCPGSPCTVTGLTNGTEYEFVVVAVNEIATSLPSSVRAPVTPATVPTAPVTLTVDRGNGVAELTFVGPADDGGSPITRYEVSKDGGATWSTLATSGSAPITATVTGLSNGTTYDFKVRAVNLIGVGSASDPVGVAPADEPDVPTGVTATRGDGQATVAFTAPADNGSAITSYTVTSTPDGKTGTCTTSPCVVSGLDNGTGYRFRIVATNDVGNSDESDLSNEVTPAAPPSAPTDVDVASAAGAVLLSFEAPASDGSDPITGYEVSTDAGDTWQPITTSGTSPLTATVTGLENGVAYAVQVRAVNSVGTGAVTAAVSVTPATVPTAPRSVHVAVHDGEVTVSWQEPSFDGGSPILFYGVTAQPGGQVCVAETGTSCAFENLTTGTTYTFEVFAVNGVDGKSGTGESPPGTSEPTLVSAVPGVPQHLSVVTGDRTLGLVFEPPVSDGGRAITRYQVSLDGGTTWQSLHTTGTTPLRASLGGVRNGVSYDVQVRAVNGTGAGLGTASVRVSTGGWFTDPVSKADRKSEVAVPKHPSRYHGKARHTRATYRSHNGTTAYPAARLKGRQLQSGQAVNLTALFTPNSSTLSKAGRAQVKATATSLRYVSAVTCEGYTDYVGKSVNQRKLGLHRANAVCAALKGYAKGLTSAKVVSYGGARPVVIGPKAARAANRRVVLLIRK